MINTWRRSSQRMEYYDCHITLLTLNSRKRTGTYDRCSSAACKDERIGLNFVKLTADVVEIFHSIRSMLRY